MTENHADKDRDHLIEVTVVYPSAHHPAAKNFPPNTLLREVKAFALDFFNLKEGSEGSNQVVFSLYLKDDKIENLDQPLSVVAKHEKHVRFRLAKEVVAG